MASRTEVVLEFVGDDSRLNRTLRNVERRAGSVLGVIGKMGKIGGAASGFLGMANGAMTLGSALTTVAPAALALPGILGGIAVATQTAKLALSGFSDAVGGDAEALAKFSPAGQAAVKAVQGLGTGFKAMRSAVQKEFFAGLSTQIKTTGAELLKVGTADLPKVAAGFNGMAREALAAAASPVFTGGLSTIITNTAGALGNMRNTAANALSAFVGLGEVGSTYLPVIGTAIDNVAQKFNNWVDAKGEAGIRAMIDGAIEGFRQLGALIGSIGQVAMTVWTGLQQGLGASATPLTMLTEKVNIFNTALQSPLAQQALQLIGQAIAAVAGAFNAVLPVVVMFAATLATTLLPAVIALAGWIQQYPTVFTAMAAGLGAVVAGVKLLIGVAAVVRTALQAWQIAQTALNVVMSMNPIGLVVIAIAALVAVLVLAWQNSETFRSIVIGAWDAVKAAGAALVAGVQAAFAWFASLPGLAAQWFGGLVTSAQAKGAQMLAYIQSIPGRIMSFLGNIGSLLISSGRALIDGFWNGIKSVWNGLVSWFQGQLAWFRGLWPFSPAKWGPFSGTGYVTYSGEALVGDFAKSLASGMPAVGRAAEGLMGAAAGPLGGVGVSMGGPGLGVPVAARSGGGGGVQVSFTGNTSDALATVIMQLIRTGKIQIARV